MKRNLLLLVLGLLIAVGLVGRSDREHAEQQHRLYCEMVTLYDTSYGLHGWPPYAGRAKCAGVQP